MHRTKIDWCDYSWNPVTGCLHGCDYCYSRRIARRFRRLFPNGFEPTFHVERLLEPARVRTPSLIFAVSMGDLFGDWVPEGWIRAVLGVMRECVHHTFVLLTKNPKRLAEFEFPPNAWIGVSCEDQRAANERIPLLLQVPAVVRFVSLEPLLGPVDLETQLGSAAESRCALNGWHGIDWVIVGAETGPGARPYRPEWVESIIAQCREAGVPVFLKTNLNWPVEIREFPAKHERV